MTPLEPAAFAAGVTALHRWHDEVSKAAVAFERRWTRRALRRVNPDLAERLEDQIALFDTAKLTGAADEIEMHGAATCRGWQAAVRVMEAAGEEDDAYVIGFDPRTGVRVAIGDRICAASRVAEIHGDKVVWLTPDEVASMFAALEGFKVISAIKRHFPGAEVIDVYEAERGPMPQAAE